MPLQSKKLKHSYYLNDPIQDDDNFIKKAFYWLKENTYDRWYGIYYRFRSKLTRAYSYAKFGWNNHDWASNYTLELMMFKLRRLQSCLNNGNSIQNDEDVKALQDILKVLNRLSKGRYDRKYRKIHDKKWGELRTWFTPVSTSSGKLSGSSMWNHARANARSEEELKQERIDSSDCFYKAKADREADYERLGILMKGHFDNLWD